MSIPPELSQPVEYGLKKKYRNIPGNLLFEKLQDIIHKWRLPTEKKTQMSFLPGESWNHRMAWAGSNLEVPTPSEKQLTTVEKIMSPVTDTKMKKR